MAPACPVRALEEQVLPTQCSPPRVHRKFTKHLVEKKRRDRINQSLEQLKELLLGTVNTDPATFEKMEKADILQMTVEYMKRLASLPVTSDQSSTRSYSSGYDECHRVAHAYLRSTRMEHNMKSRLVCHEPSIVTRDVICVCRPRQRYSSCDATTDNAVYLGGTELFSPECGYGVSPEQSTTVCITTPLKTNVSVNVDSVWRPW
ncbi:Transcription factor HES-1 [Lamellibrachia satsuma]|nr:Transcription factor HES-1 [Lamellibrachia satsuma]